MLPEARSTHHTQNMQNVRAKAMSLWIFPVPLSHRASSSTSPEFMTAITTCQLPKGHGSSFPYARQSSLPPSWKYSSRHHTGNDFMMTKFCNYSEDYTRNRHIASNGSGRPELCAVVLPFSVITPCWMSGVCLGHGWVMVRRSPSGQACWHGAAQSV